MKLDSKEPLLLNDYEAIQYACWVLSQFAVYAKTRARNEAEMILPKLLDILRKAGYTPTNQNNDVRRYLFKTETDDDNQMELPF